MQSEPQRLRRSKKRTQRCGSRCGSSEARSCSARELAGVCAWRARPIPSAWLLSCRCRGSGHPDDGGLQPGAPWVGCSRWCLSNRSDRQCPRLPPGGGWSFARDQVGGSRTHLGEGAGPEGALGGLTRLQRTPSSLPGPREVREYGHLPPSGRGPPREVISPGGQKAARGNQDCQEKYH